MTVASWRSGLGVFKADAQKVADEIRSIGEEVSPVQIVAKARNKDTELHKCFEWDDTKVRNRILGLYRNSPFKGLPSL